MDRATLELNIAKVLDKIEETEPGTKEYSELSSELRNLQDALSKDISLEENRLSREAETKSRNFGEKMRFWGMVLVAAITGGFTIGGELIKSKSKADQIEALKQIKEDQGIIDKDVYNFR